MVRDSEGEPMTRPWIYMIRMGVFIVLGLMIAAILYRAILQAFAANPPLNGLIVGVLLIGIVLAFRQVWRLFNEIEWANHFLRSDTGVVIQKSPDLLLPMARLLSGRSRRDTLTPANMRVVLDSVSARAPVELLLLDPAAWAARAGRTAPAPLDQPPPLPPLLG